MFTKRTIKPHQAVTSVDTASEALAVSIAEKAEVDMAYMAELSGKTQEELAQELRGVIFRLPGPLAEGETPRYVTADEYLSGNVRRKLRQAQRAADKDPAFSVNVEALTAAQPKDLDASEIEVRLGATWIDKDYIQQFMYETFHTPYYLQGKIEVKYVPYTAEWQITSKNAVGYGDVAANTTYGTDRANAYKILEDSLNLRDVRIYDTVEDAEGRERRVLNAKETTLAAQKQMAIREAFRDWIWKDPQRRQTLVRQYNEEMNSIRPREYDGQHIRFAGMNPEITLREHQKNAIAHVLYGGNTLLAHEVGAGKTFEMVAAAMESKRLGLCQKSLFVVPNHLTEQWASEFLRLYPSANILVTTKKDFESHNRKKFCARIATGDYDAVIIGHSQFERIPISRERQERLLREQINEIISLPQVGVPPKRGDQRLGHVLHHADFIIVAVLDQLGNILFKLWSGVYHIVAEKIIGGDTQRVGDADDSGQADFCTASFDVADVRGGQAGFFRQMLLLHVGFDPGNLDPLANCLVIKFKLHEAPPLQ